MKSRRKRAPTARSGRAAVNWQCSEPTTFGAPEPAAFGAGGGTNGRGIGWRIEEGWEAGGREGRGLSGCEVTTWDAGMLLRGGSPAGGGRGDREHGRLYQEIPDVQAGWSLSGIRPLDAGTQIPVEHVGDAPACTRPSEGPQLSLTAGLVSGTAQRGTWRYLGQRARGKPPLGGTSLYSTTTTYLVLRRSRT